MCLIRAQAVSQSAVLLKNFVMNMAITLWLAWKNRTEENIIKLASSYDFVRGHPTQLVWSKYSQNVRLEVAILRCTCLPWEGESSNSRWNWGTWASLPSLHFAKYLLMFRMTSPGSMRISIHHKWVICFELDDDSKSGRHWLFHGCSDTRQPTSSAPELGKTSNTNQMQTAHWIRQSDWISQAMPANM